MPLHAPAGWHVARIPDPPFPDDLIVLYNDEGRQQVIVKGDNPILWDFLSVYAVPKTWPELALHFTRKLRASYEYEQPSASYTDNDGKVHHFYDSDNCQ